MGPVFYYTVKYQWKLNKFPAVNEDAPRNLKLSRFTKTIKPIFRKPDIHLMGE